jgi:hypothetical protein
MSLFEFNPYIYGPPVKGLDFYGRASEIAIVLNSTIKQILFVAVRRAGKTSLLHQLSFLCNVEDAGSENICIFWNLEGIRDTQGARKRLASIPIRRKLTRVNWDKIESYDSCVDTLWNICEAYESCAEKKHVLLLIDEPDLFNYLATLTDSSFLYDIKDAFDRIPNLRVIMVSPPRIIRASEKAEARLLDNFQRYYLSGLIKSDAEQLIRLEKMDARPVLPFLSHGNGETSHLVEDILELSNYLPFYIQQICGDIFSAWDTRSPSDILEEIIESQKFSDYYVSDFKELHPIEKFITLILTQSRDPLPADYLIQEVYKKAGEQIAGKFPTMRFIDNLVNLGILKKYHGNAYHFASSLFDGWITRDFPNLWHQAMVEAGLNIEYRGTPRVEKIMKAQDFQKLRADIDAISHTINQLEKDKDDGKINAEYFYSKQASLIKERVLLFLKLKRHLDALGANELANLISIYTQNASPETITQALKSVQAEASEGGWHVLLEQEIGRYEKMDARAIIGIAYRVAENLAKST